MYAVLEEVHHTHTYTHTHTYMHTYVCRCIGGCDELLRELLAECNKNVQRTYAQQGPPAVIPHNTNEQSKAMYVLTCK